MLKELVKERLMAAADEILALFERTVASYEEELSRTREKLDAVCKTHAVLPPGDFQQLIGHQELRPHQQRGGSTLEQEDSQPPHFKEEEEDLWITQDGDCLLRWEESDLTKVPLTGVCGKIKDDEEESQADKLLAPLSDSEHTMSHAPEDEEALSSDTDCGGGIKTHTDNKHSKKKTSEKRFTCSVCAKTFTQKGTLTRHMRTHTGEKPFSCAVCGDKFAQKATLNTHMRTHTGEKPFSCSVCGKRFSEKTNMLSHMRTHTGEKPFRCSVCAKSFSHRYSLTVHMRKHSAEKLFSASLSGKAIDENTFTCSVCGKTFTYKCNLTQHMQMHSGQKPFSYSVCSKGLS